jgi:hypothetical protein
MRPEFLGDSFDIVKRFFCQVLQSLGFTVYIDPLFTGDWSGQEKTFYRFLGVEPYAGMRPSRRNTALFLDPDTGVNEKGSPSHVSYERLLAEAKNHALVFSFDQAFSRAGESGPKLQLKLNALAEQGCAALYYASHAHFLFVSRKPGHLRRLRTRLLSLGLPQSRLVAVAANRTIERDARKSSVRPSL